MLRDFTNLNAGDCIIQNGANSAVGQAVIQVSFSNLQNILLKIFWLSGVEVHLKYFLTMMMFAFIDKILYTSQ